MNKPLADDELTGNLRKATQYLARFGSSTVPHRIAGQAVSSSETFDNLDPSDNSVLCKVASGGAAEIDRAARAAEEAFQVWKTVPGEKRRALLHKIADRIEARAEEIALVESVDSGQAIRYMSKAALRGAENFRFYADKAPGASDGLSMPTETHLNYTVRQPIGPVGVITPWNTPFMLSTWKIAPALAAGCTIVHKPAEWSPLSAVILSEIMSEVFEGAGLPERHRQPGSRLRRECGQGADRASVHQGHRLCRRVHHRQPHHGAGGSDAEARSLRTGRQKSGDRVR